MALPFQLTLILLSYWKQRDIRSRRVPSAIQDSFSFFPLIIIFLLTREHADRSIEMSSRTCTSFKMPTYPADYLVCWMIMVIKLSKHLFWNNFHHFGLEGLTGVLISERRPRETGDRSTKARFVYICSPLETSSVENWEKLASRKCSIFLYTYTEKSSRQSMSMTPLYWIIASKLSIFITVQFEHTFFKWNWTKMLHTFSRPIIFGFVSQVSRTRRVYWP